MQLSADGETAIRKSLFQTIPSNQIALHLFGRSQSSPSKGTQRQDRRELVRKALTQLDPIDAENRAAVWMTGSVSQFN